MLCCDQEEETEAKDLSKMRNDFRAAVVSVLTDKEPTVRRAGLHGVLHLGAFFGQMFGATKTTQTSRTFLQHQALLAVDSIAVGSSFQLG